MQMAHENDNQFSLEFNEKIRNLRYLKTGKITVNTGTRVSNYNHGQHGAISA